MALDRRQDHLALQPSHSGGQPVLAGEARPVPSKCPFTFWQRLILDYGCTDIEIRPQAPSWSMRVEACEDFGLDQMANELRGKVEVYEECRDRALVRMKKFRV